MTNPSAESWEEATLGSIARRGGGVIQTGPFGSQLHAHDYIASGVPVVMPVNIGDNRVVEAGIARVSETDAVRLSRHRLRRGDIVYSRRGDVERRALIRDEIGWLCGTGCLLVRVGGPSVDSTYVSYWLDRPDIRAWIVQRAVGATMPNLNTGILSGVPIALPRIEIQEGIAATLGALDDKIQSNTRLCYLLENESMAAFESLFDTENVISGTALSDLIQVNPTRPLRRGSDATYIGMADLPTHSALIDHWDTKPFSSGQRFSNDDVLLARITPCLENGKTAVVDMLADDEVAWGSTEFIVLAGKPPLSMPWVYCLVRTDAFRRFAIRNMTGTSGRQRFPSSALDGYRIPIPDPSNADQFNSQTIPSFRKMAQLRNENHRLKDLRDALLPELTSGRLLVPESLELAGA